MAPFDKSEISVIPALLYYAGMIFVATAAGLFLFWLVERAA